MLVNKLPILTLTASILMLSACTQKDGNENTVRASKPRASSVAVDDVPQPILIDPEQQKLDEIIAKRSKLTPEQQVADALGLPIPPRKVEIPTVSPTTTPDIAKQVEKPVPDAVNKSLSESRSAPVKREHKGLDLDAKLEGSTLRLDASSSTRVMSFSDCLRTRDAVVKSLSVYKPLVTTLVDSKSMAITELCTEHGTVVLTCNASEQTYAMNASEDNSACKTK